MSRQYSKNGWQCHLAALGLGIVLLCGCSVDRPEPQVGAPDASDQDSVPTQAPATATADKATQTPETAITDETTQPPATVVADVISVQVAGEPNAYRFSVEISSPDEGCEQYADWWEILTEEGELVYRRILAHSHVDEQPFVRSGGPVAIGPDTIVLLRAHIHPAGYGGRVMRGTARAGFEEVELDPDFALEVETIAPQSTGCAF
jgi:hypothetical protein